MDVMVFAEQRDGRLKQVSFQALGLAKELVGASGGNVSALLVGSGIESLKEDLFRYGADKVFLVDNEKFTDYSAGLYAEVLAATVKNSTPNIVLLGATAMGRDLAPRAAARCGRGIMGDIISITADSEGKVTAIRPIYAGKAHCEVRSGSNDMQFVTIRQNIFSALDGRGVSDGEVEAVDLSTLSHEDPTPVKEVLEAETTRQDVTEANIIVSGGRGLKSPEHFDIIEELADTLGAAVGASRAAVDAGWKPHSFQVGLTGKTVSPLLYIACGISGAVQHQAGMSSSKYIVAINKDPDAPMFKIANYGIVGDLFEIVPILIKEIRTLIEKE